MAARRQDVFRQSLEDSPLPDVTHLGERQIPTYGGSYPVPTQEQPESQEDLATDNPPALSTWPSQLPPVTRSDPLNPRRPEIIQMFLLQLEIHGRAGLSEAIVDYAEHQLELLANRHGTETAKAQKSWQHLVKDREDGTNHVICLLQALPHDTFPTPPL